MLEHLARLDDLGGGMQRFVAEQARERGDVAALRVLAARDDLLDDVDAALLAHPDPLVAAHRLAARPRPAARCQQVVDRLVDEARQGATRPTAPDQQRTVVAALVACARAELDTTSRLALVGTERPEVIDALVAGPAGVAGRLAGEVVEAVFAVRAAQVGRSLHSARGEDQMLRLAALDPPRWLAHLVGSGWTPAGWHLAQVAGLIAVGRSDELAAPLGEMAAAHRPAKGIPGHVQRAILDGVAVGMVRHDTHEQHARALWQVATDCGMHPQDAAGRTLQLLEEHGPAHLADVEAGTSTTPWVAGAGLLSCASNAGVLHLAQRWMTRGGSGALAAEVLVAAQSSAPAAKGTLAALRAHTERVVAAGGPLAAQLAAHGLQLQWISREDAVAASRDLGALLRAVAEHPRNGALCEQVLDAVHAAGRSGELPCRCVVGPRGLRAQVRDAAARQLAHGLGHRVDLVAVAAAMFEEFDGTVAELVEVCQRLADQPDGRTP